MTKKIAPKTLEAIVLDAMHLELKTPLPEAPGQRVLIQIVSPSEEQEHLLSKLKAAYLTMSEREREAEVILAEEGLRGQPNLAETFPEEDEWPWWE